jgi:hypothetical protein
MALLSSFRITSHCPHCGAETDVWIQSHVGSDGATYRIGDDVAADVNLDVIRSASFVVREPDGGEPIHVLMAWTCDKCDFEGFAEVVFANGRVADIKPVELTVDVLDRLHFVEEAINYKIELYTNHSMWDEWGVWPSWVRALRENLMRAEGKLADESEPDDFPRGATLDHGRYRIEEQYLGLGHDQLWFAHSVEQPGTRYLVSIAPNNGLRQETDGPGLLQRADGLFVPRFLGELDLVGDDGVEDPQRRFTCAYVEELPAGAPVRVVCTDLRLHAVSLGAQIGVLLERALASGVLDVWLRPEYVWVAVDANNAPTVTGIGGRSTLFFGAARRRRDLVTAPLFTTRYIAPEVRRGEPADDRALVLTLGVMIAEWLVGEFPYAQDDGAWGHNRLCDGEHVALPAPPALADLLTRALRPDPAQRPDLETFTRTLASLASR